VVSFLRCFGISVGVFYIVLWALSWEYWIPGYFFFRAFQFVFFICSRFFPPCVVLFVWLHHCLAFYITSLSYYYFCELQGAVV